jgi:hypothetical protein
MHSGCDMILSGGAGGSLKLVPPGPSERYRQGFNRGDWGIR